MKQTEEFRRKAPPGNSKALIGEGKALIAEEVALIEYPTAIIAAGCFFLPGSQTAHVLHKVVDK
jgi:hypothetical protein